jgi:hypothetical protein
VKPEDVTVESDAALEVGDEQDSVVQAGDRHRDLLLRLVVRHYMTLQVNVEAQAAIPAAAQGECGTRKFQCSAIRPRLVGGGTRQGRRRLLMCTYAC